MRFSLVVATRGRTEELSDLFTSLVAQGRRDFEVLVVDQNEDDRLGPVIADHSGPLKLRWLRLDRANASSARNLGLQYAQGELVVFPDDDCVFPEGVLDHVDRSFRADPALDILTGPAASPEGGLGSGRWRQEAGPITLENVWTSVIEFNMFIRRELALELGGFDENIGPGSSFGSAEGNDLVCRAIGGGAKAMYDAALRIVHPDKRLSDVAVERAYRYGKGLGLVLRRHRVPAAVWLPFVLRPAAGSILSALRLRGHAAAYYLMTLRGRLAGFTSAEGHAKARIAPLRSAEEVRNAA